MGLDLEKGYTRLARHQSGRRVHMLPDGYPHAVRTGEQDTLCGRMVRTRLPFPLGMGEELCPDCAELVKELEAADRPTS